MTCLQIRKLLHLHTLIIKNNTKYIDIERKGYLGILDDSEYQAL